jgi:hypothetical protein
MDDPLRVRRLDRFTGLEQNHGSFHVRRRWRAIVTRDPSSRYSMTMNGAPESAG